MDWLRRNLPVLLGGADMLVSKKWRASLVGMGLTAVNGALGAAGLPAMDEATLIKLLAILVAYVVGQGVADIGKGKPPATGGRISAEGEGLR